MTSFAERTRREYTDLFNVQLMDAEIESFRLSQLFEDVCWYNFETHCRTWKHPWRRSDPDSHVYLLGANYQKLQGERECATFPTYWDGRIADAPQLPPQIVFGELRDAVKRVDHLKEQVSAPFDWAPGGEKYEALRRNTLVGRTFSSAE